jgi:uncharacterized OB-fold protein
MSVPRFWREIPTRYNLQGNHCPASGQTYYPPRVVCPEARRESIGNMEPYNLSGTGHIIEWTRVHKAAPGYEGQVPYTVAWIQTPDGPVLTGQIVDFDRKIETGDEVQAVFRRISEDGDGGVIYYGTKWVLVDSK